MGASSIASGVTEVGLGAGIIIIGLASDGSDKMARAVNSIPVSVHDALGQAFDVVLDDDNQTIQTIFSLIDLGMDIAELNTSTYQMVDIFKTINAAANAYNKTYNCITTTLHNDIIIETEDNENHHK